MYMPGSRPGSAGSARSDQSPRSTRSPLQPKNGLFLHFLSFFFLGWEGAVIRNTCVSVYMLCSDQGPWGACSSRQPKNGLFLHFWVFFGGGGVGLVSETYMFLCVSMLRHMCLCEYVSLQRHMCLCVSMLCSDQSPRGTRSPQHPKNSLIRNFFGGIFLGGGGLAETHVSVCEHVVFR